MGRPGQRDWGGPPLVGHPPVPRLHLAPTLATASIRAKGCQSGATVHVDQLSSESELDPGSRRQGDLLSRTRPPGTARVPHPRPRPDGEERVQHKDSHSRSLMSLSSPLLGGVSSWSWASLKSWLDEWTTVLALELDDDESAWWPGPQLMSSPSHDSLRNAIGREVALTG